MIALLKRCLERAEECFKESEQSCIKSIEHSDGEAGDCEELAIQARTDEILVKSRALGATATRVANVVEASIHFFTSGFAALMAAVVGSVAVVAVAGAATDVITSDLAESEKAFRKLHESFDSTTNAAFRLHKKMLVVRFQLKSISSLIREVEYGRDDWQIESVCSAIDLLLIKCEAIQLPGDSKG